MNNKYHYFYNGVFSNFYVSPYTIEFKEPNCIVEFQTSEQGFMYSKALQFRDFDTATAILKAKSPGAAKSLGRQVKGYDDTIWEGVREDVMYMHCKAKFSQNDALRKKMLSVKGTFVEASPMDRIWGIGMSVDEAERLDQTTAEKNWKGRNLLGRVLTRVRDELNILN